VNQSKFTEKSFKKPFGKIEKSYSQEKPKKNFISKEKPKVIGIEKSLSQSPA